MLLSRQVFRGLALSNVWLLVAWLVSALESVAGCTFRFDPNMVIHFCSRPSIVVPFMLFVLSWLFSFVCASVIVLPPKAHSSIIHARLRDMQLCELI